MKNKMVNPEPIKAKVESLTAGMFEIAPEAKENILRSRAQALAREAEIEGPAGESLEVLAFLLAHERYAIETGCIREVYPLTELTPLPCTPAFVRGIINIRGQILTVIDMKVFFDLPEKGITNLNRVIVAGKDDMELGILADEIIGISNIPVKNIFPAPSAIKDIHADYLRGVTGERLIVLDMERLLADQQLVVNEEVRT
jgi:purine-binding chemotaxis protein CheW